MGGRQGSKCNGELDGGNMMELYIEFHGGPQDGASGKKCFITTKTAQGLAF